MSGFWISAVSLLGLAFALVAIPWLKSVRQQKHAELTNTQVIKQRLEELEREVSEGLINESDKDAAIKELKLALVDEKALSDEGETVAKPVSHPAILGVFLLLAAGAGYVYWDANQLEQVAQMQTANQRLEDLSARIVQQGDPSITDKDMQDFALGVRMRLANDGENATGWMLLGRLHMSMRQLQPAIDAFEKSYELEPNNTGVLQSYSQALMMTRDENYMNKANALLTTLVELQPEDDNAALMLTLASIQVGNTEVAKQQFAKIEDKLDKNDPIYQSLSASLNGASEAPSHTSTAPESVAKGETAFVVHVEIEDQLRDKIPPGAVLFVFAQDANSEMRMPAAVVRMPLSELPAVVKLTDDNAMMETFKLSALTRARLVARVSVDQNVATVPGELQGEVEADVEAGVASMQRIVIDKEIM